MNRRRWPLLWTAWKAAWRQCEALVVVTGEVFSGGSAYAGDTGTYLRVLAAANRALAAGRTLFVRWRAACRAIIKERGPRCDAA